jgi:hypothetical protein
LNLNGNVARAFSPAGGEPPTGVAALRASSRRVGDRRSGVASINASEKNRERHEKRRLFQKNLAPVFFALLTPFRGCLFGAAIILFLALMVSPLQMIAASGTNLFAKGICAYRAGDFALAAEAFRAFAAKNPASGALQNLGNAEWQRERAGEAILAWEQALWLNPFDGNARNNLRFARHVAQLESPELRWFEIASAWLPTNWWAWLAGFSLWIAVGLLVLPAVLRWKRAAWHQAVAALGLGVFLLCIPAHVGTLTRAKIGFVLQRETPLRLTPTSGAQVVTRLAAGDPVRRERTRGSYVFVRCSRAAGWIQKSELGWISSNR